MRKLLSKLCYNFLSPVGEKKFKKNDLMNKFANNINNLIGYRTDYLLEEINDLQDGLGIDPLTVSIEEIDTVFIKSINLQIGYRKILSQLENKKDDYLSIHYKVSGKQYTLKSFGKISKIGHEKIFKIVKLITLMKLVKQMNDLSYLASGVRLLDETLEKM